MKTNYMPTAVEIYNQLNQAGIIGQEEYKKALAQFGYKQLLRKQLAREGTSIEKCNLCVAGPSGSAKTMGIEALAKILGVDFYRVDGANICQSGYKGSEHVDDILPNLFAYCGESVRRMENAIIFVDEFDKVIDQYQKNVNHTDTGTANNFLKLIEGQAAYSPVKGAVVDTRKISFIVAGTFGYFDKQKAAEHQFGFVREAADEFKLTPEYLIHFGFSPEIVGRFSLLTQLQVLTTEQYRQIIDSPKGAVAGTLKVLELQDVKVTLTDAAKDLMAHIAQKSGIGARSISQSIQQATSSCIFDVQENLKINEIVIDDVDGKLACSYKQGKRARKTVQREQPNLAKGLPSPLISYDEIAHAQNSIAQGIQDLYRANLEGLFVNKEECDFSKLKEVVPFEETMQDVEYVLSAMKKERPNGSTLTIWRFTKNLLETVTQNERSFSPMGAVYTQSVKTFTDQLLKEVKDHELLH